MVSPLAALVLACCIVACTRPEPQAPPEPRPAPAPVYDAGTAVAVAPADAGTVALEQLPIGPPECPGAECPLAPGAPTKRCTSGRHIGFRGPCIRYADGHCGWTRLVCPEEAVETCDRAACGAPAYERWRCPGTDETGAFEACVREVAGGPCHWVYRTCPFVPQPPAQVVAPPTPPPKTYPCDPLPGARELKTWEVRSICQPGGGPAPPPIEKRRSLGDGTHIFEGRDGCFRARYRKCYSK